MSHARLRAFRRSHRRRRPSCPCRGRRCARPSDLVHRRPRLERREGGARARLVGARECGFRGAGAAYDREPESGQLCDTKTARRAPRRGPRGPGSASRRAARAISRRSRPNPLVPLVVRTQPEMAQHGGRPGLRRVRHSAIRREKNLRPVVTSETRRDPARLSDAVRPVRNRRATAICAASASRSGNLFRRVGDTRKITERNVA